MTLEVTASDAPAAEVGHKITSILSGGSAGLSLIRVQIGSKCFDCSCLMCMGAVIISAIYPLLKHNGLLH